MDNPALDPATLRWVADRLSRRRELLRGLPFGNHDDICRELAEHICDLLATAQRQPPTLRARATRIERGK